MKKGEEEKAKEKELNDSIMVAVSQLKVPRGVDTKSIVCEFHKARRCTKGSKCNFSHDLNVQRKRKRMGENIDIYSDKREAGTMEEWDQEMPEMVVESKKNEYDSQNKATEIVCKFFLEAVEKKQYGLSWVCPNGNKECHHRHALPPGHVLTPQMKALLEEEDSKYKHLRAALKRLSSATRFAIDNHFSDVNLVQVPELFEGSKGETEGGATSNAVWFAGVSPPPIQEDVDGIIRKIEDAVHILVSKNTHFCQETYAQMIWGCVSVLRDDEDIAMALVRLSRELDVISGFDALDHFCSVVGGLAYVSSMNEVALPMMKCDLENAAVQQEAMSFSMTVSLRWVKPVDGWFKLNTDGAMRGGTIAGGGLIRSSEGKWCCGFAANFRTGTVFESEARALSLGLQTAREFVPRITHLEVESDSSTLVEYLKSEDKDPHDDLRPIINECKGHLKGFDDFTVKHIYREQNKAADKLASEGFELADWSWSTYTKCPKFLQDVLADEEMATPRSFPKHFPQRRKMV